jgi:hypothetical protein
MINQLKKSKQTSLKTIAVFWFNNICMINSLKFKCIQIKKNKNHVHLVGARNWLLWRTKLYTRAHACHCLLFTETLEAHCLCRQYLHFTSTSEFLNFHFNWKAATLQQIFQLSIWHYNGQIKSWLLTFLVLINSTRNLIKQKGTVIYSYICDKIIYLLQKKLIIGPYTQGTETSLEHLKKKRKVFLDLRSG